MLSGGVGSDSFQLPLKQKRKKRKAHHHHHHLTSSVPPLFHFEESIITNAYTAKWKGRSERTHNEHLKYLRKRRDDGSHPPIDTLLLGTSLFQRIIGTNKFPAFWTNPPKEMFNAGVGGDRVENIIWRINTSTPSAAAAAEEGGIGGGGWGSQCNDFGLLSDLSLLNCRQIIMCVGTNNFALTPPSTCVDFLRGMRVLITCCLEQQPRLERIVVMGLPCQPHLPYAALAEEYNLGLARLCEEMAASTEPSPSLLSPSVPATLTTVTDSNTTLASTVHVAVHVGTDPASTSATAKASLLFDAPVVLEADDYLDDLHFNGQGYAKFVDRIKGFCQFL